MVKKLFLLASIVCVGYFLYYGFQQMKMAQTPEADLYSQVPADAIFVLETNNLPEQWKDLESNSIIWEQIKPFGSAKKLETIARRIDSSYRSTPMLKSEFPALLFSIIPEENNHYSILFQFTSSKILALDDYIDFLSVNLKLKKKSHTTENSFVLSDDQVTLYVTEHQGIISISTSKSILKSMQSSDTLYLKDNSSFIQVKKTSSKNVKSRLFVKPNEISKSLEAYTNDQIKLDLNLFPEVSAWIELDLDLKPDEISLGGFAFASDSLQHWLSIFKNQEPMPPLAIEYLPNQTAFFLHFGFSDFGSLRKKMVARNTEVSGNDLNLQIQKWDSLYAIDIKSTFLNWIDNEIAISVIEPERDDVESEALVWVNSSDGGTIMNNLVETSLKVDNSISTDFFQIQYKGYSIHKLNIALFLEHCFGYQFGLITENYFTQMDDFIVFANSPATLQWCIDRYENGRTLEQNPAFENFTQRISEKSNIFIYSDISKSTAIYKHLASVGLKEEIDQNLEFFQKFQGLAIQVSHESEELYYLNTFVKYNPVNKKMPNTIWETSLAKASNFKPVILKNHVNNAKEVFIQDTSNIIYLIDSKGNILWNKKLGSPILSDVSQIDLYKNEKLQIAFNTKHKIYVLDRNGKNVAHFPVQLPSPTQASVLVADYDKERNYRFIIPTEDGRIRNYNSKGLETSGWNYKTNGTVSYERISFIRLKGKDYLITIFNNGTITALNRKGEIRLRFKSKFNFPPLDGYRIEGGENLESTYILAMTEQQELVKVSLNDEKERLFSITTDSIKYIQYGNLDNDPHLDITTIGSNKLTSYTIDGQKLNRFSLRQSVSFAPNFYRFDDEYFFGVVSADQNKIYISDKQGELLSPFPLRGASPFTITDLNNDGRLNLITTDAEGVLFTYTID